VVGAPPGLESLIIIAARVPKTRVHWADLYGTVMGTVFLNAAKVFAKPATGCSFGGN
jgi:hypothetical protein